MRCWPSSRAPRARLGTSQRSCARGQRSARFVGWPRSTPQSRARPRCSTRGPSGAGRRQGGPTSVRSAWSLPGAPPEPLAVDLPFWSAPRRNEAPRSCRPEAGRLSLRPWLRSAAPRGASGTKAAPEPASTRGTCACSWSCRRSRPSRANKRARRRASRIGTRGCARRSISSTTWWAEPAHATLFERIARAAKTDSTILLRGESGTGKELVARAEHATVTRAERAVRRDQLRRASPKRCSRSELFGHEKGAFTGADGLKKGKLELADGGHAVPRRDRRAAARRCRRSCCARCRNGRSNASAARGRCASTSG